jgi:fibrillarin-like rRNA methylase
VVIQKHAGLRETAKLIDKLETVCDVATALNAEFLSLERGVAAVNGAARSVQVRAETAAAYEDELTKAREQYAEQLFEQGYCPYCNTELDHTMATHISEAI